MAIFNTVYGGEPKWKPWSNTIAYYPLKWNLNDYSWHNYNWTLAVWTLTYPSNEYAQLTNVVARFPNWYWTSTTDEMTISMRLKDVSTSGSGWTSNLFALWLDGEGGWWWGFQLYYNNWNYTAYAVTWWASKNTSAYSISSWVWHNIIMTIKPNDKLSLYIDWNLKNQVDVTSPIRMSWHSWIWTNSYTNNAPTISWYLSNIINENKVRTVDEITKYYNSTKANYS